MAEEKRKTCVIDDSPFAVEIADMLRQGMTAPTVNKHLKDKDSEHRMYSAQEYSRHRTLCLGMVKLQRGRVKKEVIDQSSDDLKKAGEITDIDGIKLAKSAFFDRLRRNPASVPTKELVSVISALSRGTKSGDAEDERDKITKAMADI